MNMDKGGDSESVGEQQETSMQHMHRGDTGSTYSDATVDAAARGKNERRRQSQRTIAARKFS